MKRIATLTRRSGSKGWRRLGNPASGSRRPDSRNVNRVEHLLDSYPGSHRHLGKGVFEAKIDVGPGYRVYYALPGANRLVLLFSGDRSTQVRDIKKPMEPGQRCREV